jgi:anti-sigma-K factor RskA
MSEEHVIDLLPGYVLESLDNEDLLKVARHLSHCSACWKELMTYQETIRQLAKSVPLVTPPSDLKQKVLRKVEKNAFHSISKPSIKSAQPTFFDALRAFIANPIGLAFSLLSLFLVLFLGINNITLGQQVKNLHIQIPQDNIHVIQLQGTAEAPNASGYLMIFKNETYGALAVKEAPALDLNHQYQLWLIQNGKRTSGGVFSVNQNGYGVLEISADQPLANFESFGITIEPNGGSSQPTGKKVLGEKL